MTERPLPPPLPPPPPKAPYQGQAITAMVLGIVGIFLNFILVPSILAIFFGRAARDGARAAEFKPNGMATAGYVLGIIGVSLGMLQIIAATA